MSEGVRRSVEVRNWDARRQNTVARCLAADAVERDEHMLFTRRYRLAQQILDALAELDDERAAAAVESPQ